jgi:hypothetical protein
VPAGNFCNYYDVSWLANLLMSYMILIGKEPFHNADVLNCTLCRYLEEEWRHLRKDPQSEISISETIWQDLPSNIQKEIVEVSVHDG